MVDIVGLALEDAGITDGHAHAAKGGDALIDLPFCPPGHFGAGEDSVQQLPHQGFGFGAGFQLVQPGPDEAALQKLEYQKIAAQGLDDVVDDEDHLVREGEVVALLLDGGAGIVQQLITDLPQQCLRDGSLIGEVEIERSLRHLGALGDVRNAGLGRAAFQKQFISCVQQGFALFLLFSFHGTHSGF